MQYPNALTEQYAYDNAGNRVLKRCGEFETRYRFNNRNQLVHSNVFGLELQRQQEERQYEYDLQGNLMHETLNSFVDSQDTNQVEEKSYEYDSLNRTSNVSIQRGDEQLTQKNFYDAEGMRCGVEENGEVTNFITDGWSIVAELDKEYNVKRWLVRGYGIVASEVGTLKDGDKQSARYRFYHNNEHTDVIMLTDIDGKVVNHYEYDAFGKRQSICEQEENRYGYTGEVYDNVTEQYYLRARYYNPVIARFTQEDEYRGDGLNLYAYCGNNPVMYADPSGYKNCKKTGVDGADGNNPNNLLPDEGNVGTYKQLVDAGEVGDNITPHHMPSAEYMSTKGVTKNNSLCMNMEMPSPGTGGRHRMTDTYGRNMTDAQKAYYYSLSPRDALAYDLNNVKQIYMSQGLYSEIKPKLQEYIKTYKNYMPELFKK